MRKNEHINSMLFYDEYFRDCMRQIQNTYQIGANNEIELIWDHDRLWGTFRLPSFKGVFLIDPAPGQDHFQADDEYNQKCRDQEIEAQDEDEDVYQYESRSREYSLVWRGTCLKNPEVLLCSKLNVGKICFGSGEISGHFDGMMGVGLPHGRSIFYGEPQFGPAVVSHSIRDVIDIWNNHRIEDKTFRSSTPCEDNAECSGSIISSSPSTVEGDWTEEDQEDFVGSVTGIFDVTSREVQESWEQLSYGLTVRLHVDDYRPIIWGHFDVGIAHGFIFISLPEEGINGIIRNTPLMLHWRGWHIDNGLMHGPGEVTIRADGTVHGVFRGMLGNIDFQGTRQVMPKECSGRDISYYHRGWEL